MEKRAARDRHRRGPRGAMFPPATPRYKSRAEKFDAAVLDAYAPIAQRFAAQLHNLDLAVDTVPRMRLSADATVLPDEIVADGPVPLGRVIPAGVDRRGRPTRPRIVIFRKPIESRCVSVEERRELLGTVLTALVANHLNIDPQEIDPDFQW